MMVGLHEVMDREIVLAVVEPRPAPDDLLELDHGIDRPHQDDVADVAGIHPGREFLRRGQDRRDRLLVVLEGLQVLLAERTIVGRHAVAIIRVAAGLHLVDEVAHHQRVILGGAEDQRLLLLVDQLHEELHPMRLALPNDDGPVELAFGVALAGNDFAIHHGVVGRVGVIVQAGRELLDPERRQEAVVDALLQGVGVDRLAEIGVGVDVALTLGRGRQAELHGWLEVGEDVPPGALVAGAAPVALVDHDEIEEVRRILAEIGRGLPVLRRPAHEGLEDGEEYAGVGRHLALLGDLAGRDARQGRILEGRERGEVVVGLIGQRVAVGQEQDARPAQRLALLLPVAEIPAGLEQLPGDLEGDRGLAGAGGQGQQDAVTASRDRVQHPVDGDLLIEAKVPGAALVGKGHRREAVAPDVLLAEGSLPEFVRRRVAVSHALVAGFPVDTVETLPVAGIGEADLELGGVVLGLRHALGQGLVPGLGFQNGELAVAMDQHVVGRQPLAAPSFAFDAAGRDDLAAYAAALDHAPARRLQGGVDMLGASLGFVH